MSYTTNTYPEGEKTFDKEELGKIKGYKSEQSNQELGIVGIPILLLSCYLGRSGLVHVQTGMWAQGFPSVVGLRKCCVLRKGHPVVQYAMILSPRPLSPLVAISP